MMKQSNPKGHPIRWGRVLRLSLAGLLFAFILLNVGAAWAFLDPLLRPECKPGDGLDYFPSPYLINLHVQDGTFLEGLYYPSRNGLAVLALGGVGGSLGHNAPPAQFLLDAGYGLLQLESRSCSGNLVTLGARETLDAVAGIDYLSRLPEVRDVGIALFGYSMGGAAAIRAAAFNPEVAAVVAEGGYFNLGDDFVEPGAEKSLLEAFFLYTLAGTYWLRTGENPWQVSPIDDIGKISPRPVLLIYGEHEADSGRARQQFEAAGEPKELWLVPGGGHGTNHLVAGEEYEERVLDFLRRAFK